MSGLRRKDALRIVLVIAAAVGFAASCLDRTKQVDVPLTSAETPPPVAQKASDKTFQAFSHKIKEHQQFACSSCHHRGGKSLKMDYAGHEACIGCHLNQFTNTESQTMCTICHQDMNASPPTIKAFPAKFIEGFDMKFDHGAHERGAGRPAAGCAACHESTGGPGKTILIGFQAHATCFQCHTAESKIGSCGVCHQLAPYNRTLQSQYGFKAIFRHSDHSERQGVNCEECHNVIRGAAQTRQVTNISILEHRTAPGNNCLSCHNGRRAFTGNNPLDVNSCTRCHKGAGFGKLPEGTKSDEPPDEPPGNH